MCCGGIYLDITTSKLIRVFFPIQNILIPVIDQSGTFELCQWGQRENDKDLVQDLPITGWARIESLDKPYWTRLKPQKVLIPFKSFFEKDRSNPMYPKNKATEFKLKEGELIQGLSIESQFKRIVYVVTKKVGGWIHDRYPVIVRN